VNIYDCTKCGACCRGFDVDLVWSDHGVPEDMTERTTDNIDLFKMRQHKDGSCVALCGNIGESVSCSVYENRPSVCRDFQPGNIQCQLIRIQEGLTP